MFLEWKSQDWLAKVEARRGIPTPDIQSGLNAYAKKQAAVYHNLAALFTKLWHPTLVSYGLQHLWITGYMTKHGISLVDTNTPVSRAQGIFKHRLYNNPSGVVSTVMAVLANPPVEATVDDLLDEGDHSEDSCLEDTDSGSEDDWDDDLEL